MNKIKWILNGTFPVLMAEATDGLEGGLGGAQVNEQEIETPEVTEDDDFIDSLFKEDEDPLPETEVVPDKKEEPEKKVEPEEKVEPEKNVEPEVEPEKKVEQEQEKKPEPVETKPSEEELEQQRQQFLAEIEKSFAISDEDANLIVTEPEKVLPRLAAQVYDRAMRDAAKMIETAFGQVPTMMQQMTAQQQQATEAEQQFLAANPGIEVIERGELETLINQFAPLVMQQNAKASPQEKLKALGRTIAAVKGVSLGGVTPQVPPKKEEPVKPYTPAAPVSSGEQSAPRPTSETDAFIDMLINSDD